MQKYSNLNNHELWIKCDCGLYYDLRTTEDCPICGKQSKKIGRNRIASLMLSLILLFASSSLMKGQTYLSDLEWAPDSTYVIITGLDGEPIYKTKAQFAAWFGSVTVDVDDADADPNNELDTLTVSQPGADNTVNLGGSVFRTSGGEVLKFVTTGVDGSQDMTLGQDDQTITDLSFSNDTLYITIEDGNTQSVVLQGIGDICETYTGITVSTYDPVDITLPAVAANIEVAQNGVIMTYNAGTKGHIMEWSFSAQNLNFYENLESSDIIRVCIK